MASLFLVKILFYKNTTFIPIRESSALFCAVVV